MKKIHILFVCAILAILTLGLVRTVALPQDINEYENRYAARIPAPTVSGYLEGTFQEGVESALMDQVPGAEQMKSLYHRANAAFQMGLLDAAREGGILTRDRYINFNGLRLFGDNYITYWHRWVDTLTPELDAKIAALNGTFARHPELTFYVYYIEKDTDMDFQAGVKTEIPTYLMPSLSLPADQKAVFTIDSFAQYAAEFYKTDAHWNYLGAHRGYRQLVELLGIPEGPLDPQGEAILVSDCFSGKKAAAVASVGILTEDFYGYQYPFPPMTVTINGQPGEDYGARTSFLTGQAGEGVSYAAYYGDDNGETILSTGTTGRGKLLVIGESFDNAVLKLLASHYDALYSVDLRYYEHSMGQPFDLTAYTREKGIDRVLLMGNLDYFLSDTFDPEA